MNEWRSCTFTSSFCVSPLSPLSLPSALSPDLTDAVIMWSTPDEGMWRVLWKKLRGGVLAAFCLFCLLRSESSVGLRNSLNDDLLLPYPPSLKHGPIHPHRHVRACQLKVHGNVTFESWPSNTIPELPVTSTRVFISNFQGKNGANKTVHGHFTFVNNPLRTFSVLEPGGPGGCKENRMSTVEDTSQASKCFVAQNGGFFNIHTGECLGNVVSNGRLVRNAKGIQNAQFGIKADGTMVFGYLSEEDVLDEVNPFVQLVSGVVWLLRDGEVYIEQSKRAECDKTQLTGTFDEFINVASARTAIGHDGDGRLILFHADGQTNVRGLSLWEMATFLKTQGVVNAINMDGGGSATFVVNGTLASYPSDHCTFNNMWRCARSISTVLCVHELACDPVDCGGHGDCSRGKCRCSGSWSGVACNILDCGLQNCSEHGICTENGCLCDAGWRGSNCSEVCPPGFYGNGCTRECRCQNGGICDFVNGSCTCPPRFQGPLCEQDGQCLPFMSGSEKGNVQIGEQNYLTEHTWMIITALLSLLLVVSAAYSLRQSSCHSKKKCKDGNYVYHRLEDMTRITRSDDMCDPLAECQAEISDHRAVVPEYHA